MDSILNFVLGLILGLVPFFTKIIYDKKVRKKHLRNDFLFHIDKLLDTRISNNYGSGLYELKHFFLKNPKLKSKDFNKRFYEKWLLDPFLENEFSLSYTLIWDSKRIFDLKDDLDEIKKKNKLE